MEIYGTDKNISDFMKSTFDKSRIILICEGNLPFTEKN